MFWKAVIFTLFLIISLAFTHSRGKYKNHHWKHPIEFEQQRKHSNSTNRPIINNWKSPKTCNQEFGSISAVYSTKGGRSYMEDFYIRLENNSEIGIYAILDGHAGNFSAIFARNYLMKAITDEIQQCKNDPIENPYILNGVVNYDWMLSDFIKEIEKKLRWSSYRRFHASGTTCLVVIAEKTTLTVANVGDSRAILCDNNGKVYRLSYDHKPLSNLNERHRIQSVNGLIYYNFGAWRVNGLSMSRSLGDYHRKAGTKIVLSKPDLYTIPLDKFKPKFMILASDGLWDVMRSQTAIDLIKDIYLEKSDFGARLLTNRASQLGSLDNITVMVVVFRNGSYEVGRAKSK